MRELVDSITWEQTSEFRLRVEVRGALTPEMALSVAAHELTANGYGSWYHYASVLAAWESDDLIVLLYRWQSAD